MNYSYLKMNTNFIKCVDKFPRIILELLSALCIFRPFMMATLISRTHFLIFSAPTISVFFLNCRLLGLSPLPLENIPEEVFNKLPLLNYSKIFILLPLQIRLKS